MEQGGTLVGLGTVGQGWWMAVLAVLLGAGLAAAQTYYVATTGSDAGPGTGGQPFRTMQRAAEVMSPGDKCLVRAGVYRETVRPTRSGEEGRPITFAAAPGARVVVSGADPITGWQPEAGKIHRAAAPWAFDQLFVDGRMMNLARWPNAPLDPMRPAWAEAGKGSGPGLIVDPKLPALKLEGALAHILPGARWVSWTRPVGKYDAAGHALHVEQNWSGDSVYAVGPGTRYYLFGRRELLDAPGEWHLDREEGVVRLWAPGGDHPGRHRVEAKRRELAFDLSGREHVQLEGFRIFAATISLRDAVDCRVVDCHLRYASHFTDCQGWGFPASGIMISGHDNLLADSSVTYSAGNGVMLGGERNEMRNCLVRDADYMATDCGAVWAEGRGHAIRGNTLSHTGRSVLLHRTLRAGRIEYNDMHHAGLLTSDLGITYCYGTDGEGTVIAYNLVHDNQAEGCGVGIYLDNGSSRFIVHHNVCWGNTDSGIRLNIPAHDMLVCNNTAVRNLNGTSYWGPTEDKDQAGCRMVNNIFTDPMITGTGIEVSHNYVGKHPGFVNAAKGDLRLRRNSPCVDAGMVVPGITVHPAGKAPDLGAYERGAPPWRAGHDWGEPPSF